MATLSVFMGFGGVTDTSVTVRARASGAANIDFEYSTDSGLAGSSLSAGGAVSSTTDFTGGDTITGLQPSTKYSSSTNW